MADPKIIDAVSSSPVANVETQPSRPTASVPLKIDGSALAGMLNKIAESQQQQKTVDYISPAEYVLNAGKRMQDMYARYDILRKLGSALHGKSMNDPVPADIGIDDITIKFRVAGATETSEAKIFNIACVGDIARLLSTEMGTLILAIQQEANSLTDLLKSTEATVQKAREAWENSNKDRKIVPASNNATSAPHPAEISLSDENKSV